MMVDYKKIDLYDKTLFEKIALDEKMRVQRTMNNAACFMYVLEGQIRNLGAAQVAYTGQKESVLMKCGNYIGDMNPDKETCLGQAIGIHFDKEVLLQVYQHEIPPFLRNPKPLDEKRSMATLKNNALFDRYIDGILYFFDNPDLVTEELLILKVKELILLLMNSESAPFVREVLSNLFNPQQVAFKQVIEAHLYHDVSVEELAQLTANSVSSFKRKFKKIYNDTPATYLRNAKLSKARQLIETTAESISNIAYDCGFNDLANFSKAFKSRFECAPSALRN